MAKRRAKGAAAADATAAAPPDLYYIPEPLRPFAVRIDSLVLDPHNVKDHGDVDLDAHQASLRDFGIRRLVVVRRDNRQVEAGNGTCQAALRNGWEYVPAMFFDDDDKRARAFGLADNAIATLANWNEARLQELMDSAGGVMDWAGELDVSGLLDSLMENLGVETGGEEPADDEPGEDPPAPKVATADIQISRRITVICPSEAAQLKLIAELESRGLECQLADKRIK